MTVEAGTQQERVAGRVWTVRLDPYGRPSAGAVKLSCSRPACADQCFPGGAAAGRKAAVEHVNLHLAHIRAGGGPRGEAWCACRAADCAWHTPDPTAGPRGGTRLAAGTVRSGGPDRVRGPGRKALADRGDVRAVRRRHPRLPRPGHRPAPGPHHPVGMDQAAGTPVTEREPAGDTALV